MAAKATENAASIYVTNLKQPEKAAESFKLTADYYVANGRLLASTCPVLRRTTHQPLTPVPSGTPDKAADALEKAAKYVEPVSLNDAIDYYSQACDLLEDEDRGRFAADVYRRAIAMLLRNGRVSDAQSFMERLCENFRKSGNKVQLYKMALSVVIAKLALEDEIGAQKAINEYEWVVSIPVGVL